MIKCLKRGSEFTPIWFNNEPYKTKKYISFDTSDSYYHRYETSDEFNMTRIFNDGFYTEHYSRLVEKLSGRGMVFKYNTPLLVVVYPNNKPVENTDLKNLKIIAYDEFFTRNPSSLARLKKQMNSYGMSSRTGLIFKSSSYIQEQFFIDLLAPTMEDYEPDKQLELTKEFMLSL